MLCQLLRPIFQFKHGLRIDLVDALLGAFFHLHQLGFTENFEVLRDRRWAGFKICVNFFRRQPAVVGKQFENFASGWIGGGKNQWVDLAGA